MAENENHSDIASLTVQLLSAYLANNTVPSEELAGLIQSTRVALAQEAAPVELEVDKPTFTPAVTARKSLASPDHIISMIDGKPYKTLKRHLSANGLTPDTYRERYGLPASYPMVAPTFAAMRREIAERIGLGNRKGAGTEAADDASAKSGDAKDVSAPVAPKARKQAAKPSAVKVSKAPAAKTKTAPKAAASATGKPAKAPVSNESAVEPQVVPATSDASVAAPAAARKSAKAAEAAKPKKQPAKRMARTPKPAAQAESLPETSAPTAAKPTSRWKRAGTAAN